MLLAVALFGCGPKADQPPAGQPPGSKEGPDKGPASDPTRVALAAAVKFGGYENTLPPVLVGGPAFLLQFSDAGPMDADVTTMRPALEAVPQGVGLNFNGNKNITDDGIARLKGMANLKILFIGGTKATPKCLETVKTLPNLQALSLACEGEGTTDADLAQIAGLTKLQELTIYGNKLTEAGLASLKGLTEIRRVRVCEHLGDVGLESIKGWTKLEKLELQGRGVHGDGLSNLAAERLKGFKELRELRFDTAQIDYAGLDHLSGLSKLEKLVLFRCEKVTDAGIAKLQKALPACKISRT